MTWNITDEERSEWRTGLYAANPEQAKALVGEIDHVAERRADDYRKHRAERNGLNAEANMLREAFAKQQVDLLKQKAASAKALRVLQWGRQVLPLGPLGRDDFDAAIRDLEGA